MYPKTRFEAKEKKDYSIESLFGFHSPQLAAFFSAAGHSFAKLFSKASKNTPLLAAG